MRRTAMILVAASMILVQWPVVAQEAAGTVTRVVKWKVRAGMEQKFEDGLKQHNTVHVKNNDTTPHFTFQVVSGRDAGLYLRVVPDQRWEDFDSVETWAEADDADSAINIDPYLESAVPAYYRLLPDLSRHRSGSPSLLASVIHYRLKIGKVDDFTLAMKKVHQAIEKTNWPGDYSWYALASGGEHPTFVLVLRRNKWADFNPPEKSFNKMLEEAYGQEEARSITGMIEDSIASVRSEIVRYRADLSYVPKDRI